MAYDLLGSDGPIVGDDLMGELLGDDMGDDMGDDLMGDDLMGARRRGRQMAVRRQVAVARAQGQGLPTQRPALFSKPGLSPPAIGRLPLGFGSLTCANATPTAAGGTLTARPQVAWRGSKLVIGISGVNAGNYGVELRPTIGNRPVLAGAGTIDARAYGATAIDNNLIADAAGPGIDVSLQFIVTPSVGVGDSVIIQATWTGDATV